MKDYNRLCDSDLSLLNIIWKYEPINSGKLVMHCKMTLGWQKSTTYTMIKKLTNKGLISNEKAMVSSLVSKEAIQRDEAISFIDKVFSGDVTACLRAYSSAHPLKAKDIEKLSEFIANLK